MKITDKMRLDWLGKRGISDDNHPCHSIMSWNIDAKFAYCKQPTLRQAIDSAIRKERWTSKLRFRR